MAKIAKTWKQQKAWDHYNNRWAFIKYIGPLALMVLLIVVILVSLAIYVLTWK